MKVVLIKKNSPRKESMHGFGSRLSVSNTSGFPATLILALFVSAASLRGQNLNPAQIDPARAFAHVQKLVSFGPRPPGSAGIARAQSYITGCLKKLNLTVEYDDFLANTPNGSIPMRNILARRGGEGRDVIILASHYDTLLMPNALFVGANDGGSSTALLLELARVVSRQKGGSEIWFAFF
jgi:peptidase M28-like protein